MLVIRLTQLTISGELKGSLILADLIGSFTICYQATDSVLGGLIVC